MKHLLFYFSAVTLVCVSYAQAGPRKILLKVNLGAGPVADFLGETQVLDTEGLHKTTTKDPIENAEYPEIFQTQRFSRDSDFVMLLPVPDGIYGLTLLFAETYKKACTTGGRVFDISLGTPISGVTKIIEDYDVFQVAGCASAHGEKFTKVPSKGGIVVHLAKKNQHPSLAGFVVEGYPVPKGDGSEYRAVNRAQQEQAIPEGVPGEGAPLAASSAEVIAPAEVRQGVGAYAEETAANPTLNSAPSAGISEIGASPLTTPQEGSFTAINEGEMGGSEKMGAGMQANSLAGANTERQQTIKMNVGTPVGMGESKAGLAGAVGSHQAPSGYYGM